MESNQNLSQNVKNLRKESKKNLEEFASDSGVGKSTIQDIESGKANVTLETVDTMAACLGVSPLELLAPRMDAARVLLGTLEMICKLDPDKREQAIHHIRSAVALLSGEEG